MEGRRPSTSMRILWVDERMARCGATGEKHAHRREERDQKRHDYHDVCLAAHE